MPAKSEIPPRTVISLNLPKRGLEQFYPLTQDAGLHVAGVEIGARLKTKGKNSEAIPALCIVFKNQTKTVEIPIGIFSNIANLTSLDPKQPGASLARFFDHLPGVQVSKDTIAAPIAKNPVEAFSALKEYVSAIAKFGIRALFALVVDDPSKPARFNNELERDVLEELLRLAPIAVLDLITRVRDQLANDLKEMPSKTVGARLEAVRRLLSEMLYGGPIDDAGPIIGHAWKVPPEELARFAADPDWEVRSSVASNPGTPGNNLDSLARDGNAKVRLSVAWNGQTPVETLELLASDIDPVVRQAVAGHPRVPKEVLVKLAKDSDVKVREIVERSTKRRRILIQKN